MAHLVLCDVWPDRPGTRLWTIAAFGSHDLLIILARKGGPCSSLDDCNLPWLTGVSQQVSWTAQSLVAYMSRPHHARGYPILLHPEQ